MTSSTCKRRRAFEDPGLAKIVVESIQWARTHRQARIFAYCVMPDHLHMVLQIGDPRYSLGDVVGGVKRLSAVRFHDMGYAGPLWQERFTDRILRDSGRG